MPSTTLEASVTASLEDTVKPEREIIPPSTVGSNVNEASIPSENGDPVSHGLCRSRADLRKLKPGQKI